jgi:hypothetical protein
MTKRILLAVTLLGIAGFLIVALAARLNAQIEETHLSRITSPVEPLRPEANENQIVLQMVARNASRSGNLFRYADVRIYQSSNNSQTAEGNDSRYTPIRASSLTPLDKSGH